MSQLNSDTVLLTEFKLKPFLLFSLPITLHVLLRNVVGWTDNIMVGSLGPEYMAALTVANRYFFFFIILQWALSNATGIIASQTWGAGNKDGYNRVCSSGLFVIFFVSIIMSVIIFFFSLDMAEIMIDDNSFVTGITSEYLKIIAFTFIFTSINIALSVFFTSSGDTKSPFYQQIITTVINVIGNYLLIFGTFGFPRMYASGAALSSFLATFIGTLSLIFILVKKKLFPDIKYILLPAFRYVKDMIKIGLPILLDMFVWQGAALVYLFVIGKAGTEAVAVYGIIGIFMSILFLGISGFVTGTGINIGQLIGAKLPLNAYNFAKKSLMYSILISIIPSLVVAGVSPFIPYWFKLTGDAYSATVICLLILSARQLFVSATGVLASTIRAGKDTTRVFMITLTSFIFIGLPLVVLFGMILKWGIVWIFIGMTIEEVVKSLFFYFRYKEKIWVFKSYDDKDDSLLVEHAEKLAVID